METAPNYTDNLFKILISSTLHSRSRTRQVHSYNNHYKSVIRDQIINTDKWLWRKRSVEREEAQRAKTHSKIILRGHQRRRKDSQVTIMQVIETWTNKLVCHQSSMILSTCFKPRSRLCRRRLVSCKEVRNQKKADYLRLQERLSVAQSRRSVADLTSQLKSSIHQRAVPNLTWVNSHPGWDQIKKLIRMTFTDRSKLIL